MSVLTVREVIAQLSECPPDAQVWLEDECCACSNGADEVMYVDDREPPFDYPVVVITG